MRIQPIALAACVVLAMGLQAAQAQTQSEYPLADKAAEKLVQKYQTTSCEQLAKEKQAPASADKAQMEKRVGELLRQDPKLRAHFLQKVASAVADKMVVCGFIP